jgi:ankyrin repeat protein
VSCPAASKDFLLDQFESKSRLLWDAVEAANGGAVKALLEVKGVKADWVDEDGVTPILNCVHKGAHDILQMLCQHGDEKCANMAMKNGATALHVSAHMGDLHAVQVLLEAGAAKHMAMDTGATALTIARDGGFISIVKVLEDEVDKVHTHTHIYYM